MPFTACCGYCAARYKLDNIHIGASVECRKCRNRFTAFPVEEGQPLPALVPTPTSLANGETAAADGQVASGEGAAQGKSPSTLSSESLELPAYERGGTHPGAIFGMLAFVLGGFAWLFASLEWVYMLTIPAAGLGLLLAGMGYFADDKTDAAKVWLWLGGAASLSILLMTYFWPTFFGVVPGRTILPDDSEKPLAILKGDGLALPLLEPWMDADKGSLRQGGLQVLVAGTGWLQKPGKGKSTKLLVTLRASNVAPDRRIHFEGWRSHPPILTNAAGKVFPLATDVPAEKSVPAMTITGDSEVLVSPTLVKGPSGSLGVSLLPGKVVEESLVFEAPEPSQVWFLELPNSAFGVKGSLKFRITQVK